MRAVTPVSSGGNSIQLPSVEQAALLLRLVLPGDAEEVERVDVPQADAGQPLLDRLRDPARVLLLGEGGDDDVALAAARDGLGQHGLVDLLDDPHHVTPLGTRYAGNSGTIASRGPAGQARQACSAARVEGAGAWCSGGAPGAWGRCARYRATLSKPVRSAGSNPRADLGPEPRSAARRAARPRPPPPASSGAQATRASRAYSKTIARHFARPRAIGRVGRPPPIAGAWGHEKVSQAHVSVTTRTRRIEWNCLSHGPVALRIARRHPRAL